MLIKGAPGDRLYRFFVQHHIYPLIRLDDDLITWKCVPYYWSFVRGTAGHCWFSLTKRQLCGVLVSFDVNLNKIELPVVWDLIVFMWYHCNDHYIKLIICRYLSQSIYIYICIHIYIYIYIVWYASTPYVFDMCFSLPFIRQFISTGSGFRLRAITRSVINWCHVLECK